jgi:hypothetical protein
MTSRHVTDRNVNMIKAAGTKPSTVTPKPYQQTNPNIYKYKEKQHKNGINET